MSDLQQRQNPLTCQGCGATAAANLCDACIHRLEQRLAGIADVLPDLEAAVAPHHRGLARPRPSKTPGRGISLDERVIDTIRAITTDITWAAGRITTDDHRPPHGDTQATARWCAARAGQYATTRPDDARRVYTDTDRNHARAWRAAHLPWARRIEIPGITCPDTTDGDTCRERLHAYIDTPSTGTLTDIICAAGHRTTLATLTTHKRGALDPTAARALANILTGSR